MTAARPSSHPALRPALTAAGGLAAAGAAAGVWGAGIEPHLFTVRRFELPLLPAGHRDIRVLHVSDLHLAAWQRHKMAWVARLRRLEPDFIVNTGDSFGGQTLPQVLRTFDGLLDVPGAFVLGSNDYYGPRFKNPLRYLTKPSEGSSGHGRPNLPTAQLVAAFEDRGWARLDNRSARVSINGTRISLAGLGDAHIGLDRPGPAGPEFDPAAELRLGVTHAPYTRALDPLVDAGAQALFAGHTHGGQIRIPFWGAPVTNCDLPRDQARGLVDYRGVPLEISAGLGFSVFAPVRFASPPEVSLVTLTAP